MRYGKDHKAATRARILEAAGRAFRRNGIDGAGLADLMDEAGLTKGGFYAHFASKEALAAEAVASSSAATAARMRASVARAAAHGDPGLVAIVDGYLRPEHVAMRDRGCPIGSLLSDLARGSPMVREAAAAGAKAIASVIEDALPEALGDEREARAMAILGTMSGCLQLARLETSPAARDARLAAGRNAAYGLGGLTRSGG